MRDSYWLTVPLCFLAPFFQLAAALGATAGVFPEEVFPTGDQPTSIQQADLDKDGRLDLVLTSDSRYEVSILFGRGDGSFLPRVILETPDNDLRQSAIADFNRDGWPDIVVGADYGGWVFMGLGGGVFGAATPLAGGSSSLGMVAADFNNDEELDLAVSGVGTGSQLLVFLGEGTGGFATPLTSGAYSSFLEAADLDQDGNVDLLGRGGVRLGQGDGTFESSSLVAAGAIDGVIDDFNGDGRPDIALALNSCCPSTEVVVYLSGLGATFSPAVHYELPLAADFVQSGDLDGNGRPDLVLSHSNNDEIQVLLANAHGAFGAPIVFPIAFRGGPAVTADYDGDGRTDVALTSFSGVPKAVSPGVAWVLSGRGDGTFDSGRSATFPVGDYPEAFVAADLNGDGVDDIATANDGSDGVSLLLGDAMGGFSTATGLPLGAAGTSIEAGRLDTDVDAAGTVDLVVALRDSSEVTVLRGLGDGTFGPGLTIPLGRQPGSLALGDLNEDGRLDLAVPSYGAQDVSILLGNGDGTFSFAVPSQISLGGSGTGNAVIARIDDDEHADVVVATWTGVSILYGNGDGTFAPVTFVPASARSLAVRDMDRDARPDVIVSGGDAVVLLNQGGGQFVASGSVPDVGVGPLAIGDLDGDGFNDVVTGIASYVTVAFGGPGGSLQAPRHYAVDGTDGLTLSDVDGDGRLDLLSISRVRSVVGVVLNQDPTLIRFRTDTATLSWPVLVGVPSFNIYRGSLGSLVDSDRDGLPDAGYGACRNADDPDLTDTVFVDGEDPPSNAGFFYLMARDTGGGQETDLGSTSGGLARQPGVPCGAPSR